MLLHRLDNRRIHDWGQTCIHGDSRLANMPDSGLHQPDDQIDQIDQIF